jgi:uncharacterized protein YggE
MNGRFLIAIALMFVFSFAARAAQATVDRRVSVAGECTLEVEPDRGTVTLVAENTAPDAKSAIKKATEQHEKLRSELKRSKLKGLELSTSEYSVQEQFQWENNRQVSKGFTCRIGLKVITPEIPALGEVLSLAGDAGIRNTQGLQTYLSDQKMLEEKKKCLEGAAKNAREKAEHLVKTLGSKLGAVIQIQERGSAMPGPMPMVAEAMAFADKGMVRSASPTIEGARQNLRLEVDVSFAIEP